MNLIENNFDIETNKNSKKTAKIILIVIILLLIAIMCVFGIIIYLQGTEIKLYVNGSQNDKVLSMMVEDDDGTIYFPIKEIASFLGYSAYDGQYIDKSEDASKCYIQSENDITNFVLNSKKIYTLSTSNESNYEYYYLQKPVKAINGKLYVTSEGIEKAFNVSFTYDKNKKNIYIYTIQYLIELYTTKVLDYGYTGISDDFINQKAILNNMLIVTNGKNNGVIDLNGNSIIEAKYDDIKYIPNSEDFLVKSNNKVGIISSNRGMKVQILYDSLELIDSDLGLYLAKRDNKFGIIDSNGNVKIHIEYDEIGIDNSKFEKNGIKSKYILADNLIPVRKDKNWGLFNRNGERVVDFEFDSFGYIATTNKDAINLLVVPEYNVLVANKNGKYALINSSGKKLCAPVIDDVYMTISSGDKHYYMNWNNQIHNVEDILDGMGVSANNSSNSSTTESSNQQNEIKENVINNI